MIKNFEKYLKKNKVLVFKGVQKGGYVNNIPSEFINHKEIPCTPDFSNIFKTKWKEHYFFLTIYWNEEFNNGNCYFQLDESFDTCFKDKVYRSIGSCVVTKNNIIFNESDGATCYLYRENCNINYIRNRDDNNKNPFILSASNVKISSICQRNKVMGCKKN